MKYMIPLFVTYHYAAIGFVTFLGNIIQWCDCIIYIYINKGYFAITKTST